MSEKVCNRCWHDELAHYLFPYYCAVKGCWCPTFGGNSGSKLSPIAHLIQMSRRNSSHERRTSTQGIKLKGQPGKFVQFSLGIDPATPLGVTHYKNGVRVE